MSSEQNTKHLSKTYQKKTDREHILDAPDTYIGSIEEDVTTNWIYDPETEKMIYKEYTWIPGLYKCFDEGVVNARDHFIRMQQKILEEQDKKTKGDKTTTHHPVKSIDVGINKETGMITIINDGNGIDVVKHPEYDIWIPEMIFGHLRTSTNYKKNEKKIVGGKNGFGFKLVLIYSTWGKIETIDHTRGLKYVQEFENNLSVIGKPKITKCKGKPYTKVSWIPDYKRFGIENMTADMYNLIQKRTYDISAVTDKSVKVLFNSSPCPIKTFEQYVNMYVGNKSETKRIYEKSHERWEYAVCLSPLGEFTQVSFVNGIYTSKGGKHVDYILGQITRKLVDYIEKKKKVKVKASTIKEQLMLFVNCVVENPAFDSQTKDFLNTSSAKFGSACKVSDAFIEKIAKLGVMNQAVSINDIKEMKEVQKTDGKKSSKIRGIPKLVDANNAGTNKSMDCMLILCEGDSAKAGIVSGLTTEDRNTIGIYPLKGKIKNVRQLSIKKIFENVEASEIRQIMGLEVNKKYNSLEDVKKNLRYGKIIFMTDQDLDGSHIKGLCVNLFDHLWPELVKINDFFGFMNTPILKAKKGSNEMVFYNEQEYEKYKTTNSLQGWKIKYYKGLATSTSKEFKEYMKHRKIISFGNVDKECHEAIDMAFNNSRADDRKDWLRAYDKDRTLDTNQTQIKLSDFVNKELIHFSKYDCDRNIPNLVDGLKTSLRKILYCVFKRKLVNEIKVAQLGGYVSENSGYHHGEESLMKAIVGMAQTFVGSNNINLLKPNGQFGTRLQGGKDSGSPRYIFTEMSKITPYIYRQEDSPILTYLQDDGTKVEPEFYVPIIPMILVNGTTGIGTGFSTDIMSYNPNQIIEYIQRRLEQKDTTDVSIEPYYEGFKGDVIALNSHKYLFKGKYVLEGNDTIRITELPVGMWTDKYKEILEKIISLDDKKNSKQGDGDDKKSKSTKKTYSIIKSYKEFNTDVEVNFLIKLKPGIYEKYTNTQADEHINKLEKELHLTTTMTSTNMHLFNENQKLVKYDNVKDIIDAYMEIRMKYYTMRKEYQLERLERDVMLLTNKARFIQMQCDDELDLRRKKKDEVLKMLKKHEFDTLDGDEEYKYLRNMPIDSVIEENVVKLLSDRDEKMKEHETLKNKTNEMIWLEELKELRENYQKHIKLLEEENEQKKEEEKKKPSANKKKTTIKKNIKVKKTGTTKSTKSTKTKKTIKVTGKIVFDEGE